MAYDKVGLGLLLHALQNIEAGKHALFQVYSTEQRIKNVTDLIKVYATLTISLN